MVACRLAYRLSYRHICRLTYRLAYRLGCKVTSRLSYRAVDMPVCSAAYSITYTHVETLQFRKVPEGFRKGYRKRKTDVYKTTRARRFRKVSGSSSGRIH